MNTNRYKVNYNYSSSVKYTKKQQQDQSSPNQQLQHDINQFLRTNSPPNQNKIFETKNQATFKPDIILHNQDPFQRLNVNQKNLFSPIQQDVLRRNFMSKQEEIQKKTQLQKTEIPKIKLYQPVKNEENSQLNKTQNQNVKGDRRLDTNKQLYTFKTIQSSNIKNLPIFKTSFGGQESQKSYKTFYSNTNMKNEKESNKVTYNGGIELKRNKQIFVPSNTLSKSRIQTSYL